MEDISMRFPIHLGALGAALAVVTLGSGCDVITRANNRTVLAATLLVSPRPPGAAAQGVVASVFVGQHDGGLTSPPKTVNGLAGAQVTVTWDGLAAPIPLPASVPTGNYTAVWTTADAGRAYSPGATYTFTAVVGGDTYTARVTAPATAPDLQLATYTLYPVNFGTWGDSNFTAPFPVKRTGNAIALLSVFSVTGDVGTATSLPAGPTCTNLPQDAAGLLDLVFADGDWTTPTFDLPKAALAETGASPRFDAPCFPRPAAAGSPNYVNYVVGLTEVAKSSTSQLSGNLSIFSAALVGTSDAKVITVSQP